MNKFSKHPEKPWLDWAVRLQAIAQTGLRFSQNPFDIERFEAVRSIAVEMMTANSELDYATVEELFCCESGYQTPKIDSRGVVFKDGCILLVREKSDGRWAIPGGYVDLDQTIRSNTEKEVAEEAGYQVQAKRLLLVQDHRFEEAPLALAINRFFLECELLEEPKEGFILNNETSDSGFFPLDNLPPLSERRTNRDHIRLCYEAYLHPEIPVRFY